MLKDNLIIELRSAIDKMVEAFECMARKIAELFTAACREFECMAAQPEYIRNSSLKQIGGHYFGLWWYSDVSEVTVLPVHPIIRQYPVAVFLDAPLEIFGVSLEPRPPPQSVSFFEFDSERPGCLAKKDSRVFSWIRSTGHLVIATKRVA